MYLSNAYSDLLRTLWMTSHSLLWNPFFSLYEPDLTPLSALHGWEPTQQYLWLSSTNTWLWVPLDKVVRWLLAHERMAEQSCVLSLIILRESTLGRRTNIGEPSCWEYRSPMFGFTVSATQRSPLHIRRQCHVMFKGGDNTLLWSLPPSQTTILFLIKSVDKHCIFKDATFLDLISRK